MIIVDQTELNLSKPQTYNEIWVSKWIKEFRDSKRKPDGTYGIVRILDLRPINKNRKVFKKPHKFDISGYVVNQESGVKESWKLCMQQPRINPKTGIKYYPKFHWGFFREIDLSVEENMELIFFLMKIVKLEQFGFIVEDKESIAKKKLDSRKAEYEVGNWITNVLKTEEIIQYAYRWGINPTDKGDAELRDELFEKIKSLEQQKDKKRGYRSFIEEMNTNSDIIKIGTYFYKALQSGKIAFNPNNRTCYWSENPEEKIGGTIPPERWARDKEEYIIEYLNRNPKEYELFRNSLSGEVNELAGKIDDYMMIGNAMKLRGWMREKTGYDIGLVSLEEGRNKIKEFFEKSEVTT